MKSQSHPSLNEVMDSPQDNIKKILIVGAGPASMQFCFELLKQNPNIQIHVFSNEPYQPYNKKELSNWLSGVIDRQSVDINIDELLSLENFKLSHVKIENIDKRNKKVIDLLGAEHFYDYLVLATGTRTRIPNIRGINQKGVYTFKNLKDAENLFARLTRSRSVVIVGAGIVGVQTAISLKKYNTQVYLVEKNPKLMSSVIDETCSDILKKELEALGIEVLTSTGVREIIGDDEVSAVQLFGKKIIQCDTVILCVGSRSNIELARRENLAIGEGVIVNDQMFASNKSILAIGGCCEHRGKTYGALSAGMEQATVAAGALSMSLKTNSYKGSKIINQVSIPNKPIVSFGDVDDVKTPGIKVYIYSRPSKNIYRKMILLKNRIIGFVSINMNDDIDNFIKLYENNQPIYFFNRFKFKRTGCIGLKH